MIEQPSALKSDQAQVARYLRLLEVGLAVLRQHRTELVPVLEPWAKRLPDLAERVLEVAKGQKERLPANVYEAAVRAGRSADLLDRERTARRVAVPGHLAPHEKEIQRIQARFYAFKYGELLSRELLLALSPRRIKTVLADARRAGLADEGTAWTLRYREIGALEKNLLPALRREQEHNQGLG